MDTPNDEALRLGRTLRRRLVTDSPGWHRIQCAAEMASTQAQLRQDFAEDPPHTLDWRACLTLHQTAGRGRNQSAWRAKAGEGLLLSFGGPLLLAPELWPRLSLVAGLALRNVLQPLVPAELRLKWPNDMVAITPSGPQKLAGVLCERVGGPCADPLWLCGIGVNAGGAPAGQTLHMPATSLAGLGGQAADLGALAADIAQAVRSAVLDFAARGSFADVLALEAALAFVGDDVLLDLGDSRRWLQLQGIDPSGELRGKWAAGDPAAGQFAAVSPLAIVAAKNAHWTRTAEAA